MSEGLPKLTEKRNFQRLDLELPVKLELDGKQICANTQNISCGGMFLPVNEISSATDGLAENRELVAFITIPDDCKVVKLTGHIRRIHRNCDLDPVGVAIQFSGLFDENLLEIDRYLKKNNVN